MNAIVKTERGQREPQVTTLSRLAQALGVEVEQLTGGAAQAATPASTPATVGQPTDGAGGRHAASNAGTHGAQIPSLETTQRFLSGARALVHARAIEEAVPADALLLAAGEVLSKLLLSGVPGRDTSGVPRERAAHLGGEEDLARIVVEP